MYIYIYLHLYTHTYIYTYSKMYKSKNRYILYFLKCLLAYI